MACVAASCTHYDTVILQLLTQIDSGVQLEQSQGDVCGTQQCIGPVQITNCVRLRVLAATPVGQ